jgi:hypothetical protein
LTKKNNRFALLLILGLYFLFPKQTLALAKFNTTYQITYKIEDTGKTHVSFVINQKNNLSVVYATDYGISINGTKLENITVKDEGVLLSPNVAKTQNQTSISFPFSSKVVGKDKTHTFTIDYDTTDIAIKHGSTWQIDIPRLEPDENVTQQTVIIVTPLGFSNPVYIDPKPDVVNGNIYYFSGQKVSNKSISAIFGKMQFYKGKLTYHLSNTENGKIRTEIALPPDTSYQTVYYQNLNPKPSEIYTDEDRNIMAKYVLGPKENLDITLDFTVRIDFNPKPTLAQPSEIYLAKQPIWNFDNSVFNSIEVASLKTPRSIFDYLVDKMNYDYSKLNRQKPTRSPAAESLMNSQSAICTDFTDVFVALARKSGIKARELEGFAISENPDLKPLSFTQDILHAWPEYFDKEKSTWIQVDPTWTNTTRGIDYFNKLDFNHIVFAIHGVNPEYPIPAGGYRNGEETKSISIEPSDVITFPQPSFILEFVKQEDKNLVFKVKNQSGISYFGSAKIVGNEYFGDSEQALDIAPFSEKILSITTQKQPFISKNDLKVIIYLNGQLYEAIATVGSASTPAIVLAGIGGFLAITTVTAWSLHLRRQRKKTTLYR